MSAPPDPSLWTTIGPLTGDGIATVMAALVAAAIAVATYSWQQRQARRDQQAAIYSEALRAVEEYAEAPYRVRRHDGTPETRTALTTHLNEVQSRLAYYAALLSIHAPREVAEAYERLVTTLKQQAGPQISEAWRSTAVKRDRDVPLGTAGYYSRDRIDAALRGTRDAMRSSLRKR
jgi:hypothetical protein